MFASGKKVTAVGVVFTSKCSVYLSANQSIPDNAFTKIQLDTEVFDSDNEFDNATNYRFTATNAGYYQVSVCVNFEAIAANAPTQIGVKVNGAVYEIAPIVNIITSASSFSIEGTKTIYLAANDYIEVQAYQNSGVAKNILGTRHQTYLSIHRIS